MGVVVETSGSSGVPKRVILSDEAIQASTDAAIERLGGAGQWVLALPDHYIAGMNVIWRNEASGAPLDLSTGPLPAAVAAFKRQVIESALSKFEGNQAHAAKHLGIHPSNLSRQLKQLGLR